MLAPQAKSRKVKKVSFSDMRERIILQDYDPLMHNALYEDPVNFYITTTIYICCSIGESPDYPINNYSDFYELILHMGLCSKLNYSVELPKKLVELMKENSQMVFQDRILLVANEIQKYIPSFRHYFRKDGHYRTEQPSWASIIGPLAWTWAHITFANPTSIKQKERNIAMIIVFDYIILCSTCKEHYRFNKDVLFKEMLDEFNDRNAEDIMLDLHTFVSITLYYSNKNNNVDFIQLLLTWKEIRKDARNKFKYLYRALSDAVTTGAQY